MGERSFLWKNSFCPTKWNMILKASPNMLYPTAIMSFIFGTTLPQRGHLKSLKAFVSVSVAISAKNPLKSPIISANPRCFFQKIIVYMSALNVNHPYFGQINGKNYESLRNPLHPSLYSLHVL